MIDGVDVAGFSLPFADVELLADVETNAVAVAGGGAFFDDFSFEDFAENDVEGLFAFPDKDVLLGIAEMGQVDHFEVVVADGFGKAQLAGAEGGGAEDYFYVHGGGLLEQEHNEAALPLRQLVDVFEYDGFFADYQELEQALLDIGLLLVGGHREAFEDNAFGP